jgi:predicted metal-dependent phosphoesterase TrpH
MPEPLRVEFHCHTIYSKDSLLKPEKLIETARQKKLDRVIITDHNTIAGAIKAQKIDPQLIIIGEEIMTTRGEILAAFVREEIPAGLSPRETIQRLRDQGAFISVSHPFDVQRKGHWREKDLDEILPLVDAIEIFNSRCMLRRFNASAAGYAHRNGMGATVGSDAHTARELGRATLSLPFFNSGETLAVAIQNSEINTRLSSPLIHATSRFAVIAKMFFRNLDMQKRA